MDRRITPEQWVLHLDAAAQAGVPLSAYAREHGLNLFGSDSPPLAA
jgi:hypothetical protein